MSVTNPVKLADPRAWKALRFFNLYRIVLAGLFLALYLGGLSPQFIGQLSTAGFVAVTTLYLLFSLLWSLAARERWPSYHWQVYVQAAVDLVVITLWVHFSGGITSGLGTLLVVAVGGASLLLPGRSAILFAALGSIALLLVEAYGWLNELYRTTAYTQTGILGIVLFATALLASTLARRATESEALAASRGIDLANLATLNEHIIERMQSGLIVVDDAGQIRLINEAAWILLGDPTVGNPFRLAEVAPELWTQLQEWLRDQRAGTRMLPLEGGTELQVRYTRLGTGDQLATLVFLEDTAEINQRMQEVKLASLGRLTASIAHEIRNPLGAISHAAQLMAESPDLATPDQRLVQIIEDQSRRMDEVIRNVLRLSRREPPRQERFTLKSWVEDFADDFTHHEQLDPEHLAIHIAPAEAEIVFDPSQLHQVVWNLCSNALRYAAQGDRIPPIELQGGIGADSRFPYLDVIDHGPGIDPELVSQLFEPFFTTSERGTGLGLYIARQLCENNGGRLEYIPIPTGGSCFRIQFPDPAKAVEAA